MYIDIGIWLFPGNGLIDEAEFLTWVARIQALRDESTTPKASPHQTDADDDDDDITQDLIAAFRYI